MQSEGVAQSSILMILRHPPCCVLLVIANVYDSNYTVFLEKGE